MSKTADAAGTVPFPDDPVIDNPADEFGNVEAPPEYGIEVTIHGGMVTYGPWADRQRYDAVSDSSADASDALQTAFAPSIFFDSVPRSPLQPGDCRSHTHMLVNVNLVKDTTLRIPTREPSKVSTSTEPVADLRTGSLMALRPPMNDLTAGSISSSQPTHQ